MKKPLLYIFLIISGYLLYIGISLTLMPPVADLADKRFSKAIQVKDWQGPTTICGRTEEPLLGPVGANPGRDEVGGEYCGGLKLLQE